MTAIVTTILKNVHGEAIVKFVGTGTSTIEIPDLIVTRVRKANTTNGSPTLTLTGVNGNDNIGIIVGGKVTGTGIPADTIVIAIKGRTITLDKNATATGSNIDITFDSQKAISPFVSIEKVYWSTAHASGILIEKEAGQLLLNLYGSSHWNLNELSIIDSIGTEINVTTAADDTLILKLKKYGNWGTNDYGYGNQ